MGQVTDRPFASIESAQEFIALLFESISEAKRDVEADVANEPNANPRRLEAMRLASVHLHNLEHHIIRTKRILNDLRSIRRMLFEERALAAKAVHSAANVTPMKVPAPQMPVSTVRAIRAMARAAGQ
jgi:hypothetical protein